jgi:hypothetical protein
VLDGSSLQFDRDFEQAPVLVLFILGGRLFWDHVGQVLSVVVSPLAVADDRLGDPGRVAALGKSITGCVAA